MQRSREGKATGEEGNATVFATTGLDRSGAKARAPWHGGCGHHAGGRERGRGHRGIGEERQSWLRAWGPGRIAEVRDGRTVHHTTM
jgi:hypothetical protein